MSGTYYEFLYNSPGISHLNNKSNFASLLFTITYYLISTILYLHFVFRDLRGRLKKKFFLKIHFYFTKGIALLQAILDCKISFVLFIIFAFSPSHNGLHSRTKRFLIVRFYIHTMEKRFCSRKQQ